MRDFYNKLHRVFSTSKAVFYVYYNERYTYDECYKRMRRINSVLNGRRQERVAIYASKCFDAYCAIFATLLSENVWVPLTPSQPEKRTLDIIQISEPGIIFTESELPESLAEYAREKGVEVYLLKDILNDEDPSRDFSLGAFPENDLAYIMFTSGSTGIPKGVPMTHKNYINFIENAIDILPFDRNEVFADYHDFAFDISIFYLFCAVLTESAFAPIIKKEEKFCPLDNIIKNKVTVWSSVPSVIAHIKMLRPGDEIKTKIKIMFLCGEPFKLEILKYCYENMKLKNVYNFYGLTETGVENFCHLCSPADLERFKNHGYVPIGKPLPGNDIKINSEKELLLSGCQLTPSYMGGIGKEKFEVIDGKRWYHTGDIVEHFEDVYFCKGRLDSQVKISGYRVELMDIEVNIRFFPEIDDAVCFLDAGRIVCVLKSQRVIDKPSLNMFLKDRLPSYMIPQRYFTLKSFPVNINGKTSRKEIMALYKGEILS